MNLTNLKRLFSDSGCNKIYIKKLSANDNSKNQVYLGGSFEILNILPISEIYSDSSGDWKKDRFKASITFSWITDEGNLSHAPNSQLILYPKYPEVRFSGFLNRSPNAPSYLMTNRIPDRLLYLGVTDNGQVLGYVTGPESEMANEFNQLENLESEGIFRVLPLIDERANKTRLLTDLKRIHEAGWITSKRLDRTGAVLPCLSPNCGGYTLEAELGITPNGYSEPDYLGYELKQFKVARFDRISSEVITLMTPEPTGGHYTENGLESFIRTYGYEDRMGRADRINFGGVHRIGAVHPLTGLRLELPGFDAESGKITSTAGSISLIDRQDNVAASWSFSSLLKHWNRKHNQACYIPAKAVTVPERQYYYGNLVIIGDGTDFSLFLKEMASDRIYYDPGIKMENASTRPVFKRRSQFRIKSGHLTNLYYTSETVDVLS